MSRNRDDFLKLSIFADSRFVTDGKGNFYSSSNMRRAMLYPIADKFEKIYLVCRVRQGDLGNIPSEDLINHPRIEFLPAPNFKGIFGSIFLRNKIIPVIHHAVENSDVCLLRFGSNISCLALPIIKEKHKPMIGHVVGEFDMEIRRNPRHIPIPVIRELIANWILKRGQAAFRACDVLCGVTKNIAKKYGQPNREVFQLLDSCLTEDYYSPPKHNYSSSIRAVFAGRLLEFKNVQNFLHAMAKAKQHAVKINTTIVGEGDFKNQLIKLTQKLNIENNVRFTGRVESRSELWEIYRSANTGFLLSFSEGLPLAAIEPMSVGLPLIAARLEYMKPVITNGVEGFLVDPCNIDEIVEKLKVLATQPNLRYRMGLAAYQKSKLFSSENQAIKLLHLADKLWQDWHK